MRSFPIIVAILAGVVFVPCQAWCVQSDWQLRRDHEGIAVYTRKVAGSSILEYRSSVVIQAPIEQVIAFIEDGTKMPLWFYQCVEARLVSQQGPLDKIYYFVLHLPWPVAERDTVYRSVRSTDQLSGRIDYVLFALPDQLPRHKGRVRVPYLKTLWRFTPFSGGRTEVYFQQHSDPGGSIPAFIVNKLVVDIPFYSLKGLRRMVEGEGT